MMRSWIDHAGGVVLEPSPSLIAQLVEAAQPFWLDIENPTDEVIDQLASWLGLHPLAVDDSKQFGQRAKLQVYGNAAMLVGFGLDEHLREPVEVHCYYTTGFLITLRRAPSPALDALRKGGSVHPQLDSNPIRALHPLISSLHTQFSVLVLEMDERLDALEQRVLHEADDQELAEITVAAGGDGAYASQPRAGHAAMGEGCWNAAGKAQRAVADTWTTRHGDFFRACKAVR